MSQPVRGRRAVVVGLVLLLVMIVVSAVLLLTRRTSSPSPSPTSATAASAGVAARATSADGTARIAPLPVTVEDAPGAGGGSSGIEQRQEITAFGAALTESSAELLRSLGAGPRAELLRELFAPDGPVRLGVVRVALGGSDFVTEPASTYDDLLPGEEDWDLDRFSTTRDEDAVRPVLREILAIAPDVVVIASPWSPPAWLKSSGSLEGGTLSDDPRAAETYARYLLAAVLEYRAAGTPVDYLTVQNEPQARTPDGYPGTDMPVATQAAVITELGPLLGEHGLETKILAYDHNWSLHPADRDSTPEGRDPEADYPFDVLAGPARPWVAGVAYHCYFGDASAQSALHDADPAVQIWVTECSGSHAEGASPETVFADTLSWQATNLLVGSLQNWATGLLTWNLALDADGGPHVGGCSTCTGVVTISDGQVTRNAEYYVLAHAARFLPRGSVVVATSAVDGGSMPHVAARTPDGALVVLAYNAGGDPQHVVVDESGHTFSLEVPPRSLATLTTVDTDPVPAPVRMTALPVVGVKASPEHPEDPCCTQDVPARASDGDRSTRWSSGRSQRPGDRLEVELADTARITQVVLDSADATDDWPREVTVLASRDGESWQTLVESARGDGAVLAVELDADARFLRVEVTDVADAWWSIAEITLLGHMEGTPP